MKKKVLLFLLSAVAAMGLYAQRSLEVKDITTEMNVFSGKDDEAGVVISCSNQIPLVLESSHDKVVDIYSTEEKGSDKFYYIRFNTGKKYRGRKLTINAPGYLPLSLSLELSPKELKQYRVFDPDADFVYGCYYEYRKRGADSFKKGLYKEAIQQYVIAKECSDCPADSGLEEFISNADTILACQQRAEEYVALSNYVGAIAEYRRILTINPADESASTKRFEYENRLSSDCKLYFDYAETYQDNGEYEKALEMYQKVIEMKCYNSQSASSQAKKMKSLINSRKQHARVFAYEYSKSAPIGLTTGSYKNKTGGYFSLSLHPDVFKALQKDYDKAQDMEVNVSFGWTIHPSKSVPVWIFFGPGYTGVGEYVYKNYGDDVKVDEDPTLKIYSAVSPEVGLLGKIGPLVLRYTFQYRFSLDKKNEDKFSKTRHAFGIGFCY